MTFFRFALALLLTCFRAATVSAASSQGGFEALPWGASVGEAQSKGFTVTQNPSHLLYWLKEDTPEFWTASTKDLIDWVLLLGSFIQTASPISGDPDSRVYCFLDGRYFAYISQIGFHDLDEALEIVTSKYGAPHKSVKVVRSIGGFERTDLIQIHAKDDATIALQRSYRMADSGLSFRDRAKFKLHLAVGSNKYVDRAALVAYDRNQLLTFREKLKSRLNDVISAQQTEEQKAKSDRSARLKDRL